MKKWISAVAVLAALAWMPTASADCMSRIDEIQAQIQGTVTGDLTDEQNTRLWILLTDLCGSDGTAAGQASANNDGDDDADDTVKVLGVEVKKAGPDSRGRERLKTKR